LIVTPARSFWSCIGERDVFVPEALVNVPHHSGGVGREVEPRAAFPHRAQQPAFAHAHFLHFFRARQGREYDVRNAPDVGDRLGPRRTGRDERLCAFLPDIVNEEIVARLAQVERHPRTHGADADEADLHACVLSMMRDR
jgi:hypothetical protein